MGCSRIFPVLAVLTALNCASAPLFADDVKPPVPPPPIDAAIRNEKPAFLLRVDVDREDRAYQEGDTLSLSVVSEADAYLYVLYQQADAKKFAIYPNRAQRDNFVKAKQQIRIPATDDLFRWVVGPPFGKEIVKVIASRKPLAGFADAKLREKRFNPLSAKDLTAVEQELGKLKPADWAEVDIKITTRKKDAPPPPRTAKRFGVFFGVSEYRFNKEYERTRKKKSPLNLRWSHNDARGLSELFRRVGKLDDQRLYINAQATRAQIERSLTVWLPAVSKPGDTVFIYFSGHGARIPDDNRDERDGKDELICPYGFADIGVAADIAESLRKKRPAAMSRTEFNGWAKIMENARQRGVSPNEELIRATAISDDLFGHWLQKLDGRQVLVIIDSCHSGGFATQEKGDEKTGPADADFDFLDGEFSRLKDIGQKGTAMLAASTAEQLSLEFSGLDHGLMTFTLMTVLEKKPGSLKLAEAHAFCRDALKEFFKQLHARQQKAGKEPTNPHQPNTFNNSGRPVFLKR